MKLSFAIKLQATAEQHERLLALQRTFAQACNALTPLVISTKIWNRVALHHMGYRTLREQFPALGSQLACNAVYAVSRASRILFQAPGSPFHISRFQDKGLPKFHFTDRSPVYLDRHTISLKGEALSLFTLDGRMRFQLKLTADQSAALATGKLREVLLRRTPRNSFEISFDVVAAESDAPGDEADIQRLANVRRVSQYVHIQESI